MDVAVQMAFKADRKEPLGALVRRVAEQFERGNLRPELVATFSDGPPGIRTTSAVERAIRKHPHLAGLERNEAILHGIGLPAARRLTNADASTPFELEDILALADAVPRSLPFHAVAIHFGHPDFGSIAAFPPGMAPPAGVAIDDRWWVNGRSRGLSAFYVVAASPGSKKLPDPPGAIAAILAGFGKPKRTAQVVAPGAAAHAPGTTGPVDPGVPPDTARIAPIVARYKAAMKTLVERIALPYDLPPASEARMASLGANGPLKPALVEAFAPRGYDCRGGSGTFTLRRRTGANHVVEIELDVGTWSRSLTFMFHVRGPGFTATLFPPVTARDTARQYPIGDTENWKKIVANVGAIVDQLERTFVPEIESAVDPAPEWFDPGR
jgi:hypothetical protein